MTKEKQAAAFEEWIKITSENKLNVKNTWTLPLIDYFSEMSFLKEDNDSINFQIASTTLDGCVKIYSSRVDSVADETGRLLTGLSEGVSNPSQDPEEIEENIHSGKGLKSIRKFHEHTLAKTFESLNAKSFEMNTQMDPLFQKTCADFDRGGRDPFFLLGTLPINQTGHIVFDSQIMFTFEDTQTTPTRMNISVSDGAMLESATTQFSSTFAQVMYPDSSPFELPTTAFFEDMVEQFQDIDVNELPTENDHPFGSEGFLEPYESEEEITIAQKIQRSLEPQIEPIYTKEPILELSKDNDLFSYFNRPNLRKNWIGPDHWKMPILSSTKPTVKKSTRKALETVFFDFENNPEIDIRNLFAKPASAQSLLNTDKKQLFMLPDDLNIGAKEITSLFTKPEFSVLNSTRSTTKALQEILATEESLVLFEDDNLLPDLDNDYQEEIVMEMAASTLMSPKNMTSSLPSLIEPKILKFTPVNFESKNRHFDVQALKEKLLVNLPRSKQVSFRALLDKLDDQDDTSTISMAFVSLLHLANEKNLTLQSTLDYHDLLIEYQ